MFSSNLQNNVLDAGYTNQKGPFTSESGYNINGNSMNGSNNESNIQQFAPNFLFGTSNASRRRTLAGASPSLRPSSAASGILKSKDSISSPSVNRNFLSQPRVHFSPMLTRERSLSPAAKRDTESNNRDSPKQGTSLWKGPPLRSIYDELSAPTQEKQARLDEEYLNSSSNIPSAMNSSRNSTAISSSSSSKEKNERDYWVTVFGFPNEQQNNILDLFSKHGDIVTHKFPTTTSGNWIHIRYSSPIHTNQALDRNGNIFNGYMIGVVPCTDREIVGSDASPTLIKPPAKRIFNNSTQENASFSESNVSVVSQNNSAFRNFNSLPNRSRRSMALRNGIRPLNGGLNIEADSPANTSTASQQNGSFFGKFWSYLG